MNSLAVYPPIRPITVRYARNTAAARQRLPPYSYAGLDWVVRLSLTFVPCQPPDPICKSNSLRFVLV